MLAVVAVVAVHACMHGLIAFQMTITESGLEEYEVVARRREVRAYANVPPQLIMLRRCITGSVKK